MIQILPPHLAPTPTDPQPVNWEEFAEKLRQEWRLLLDSNPSETSIQSFLEKYPCLLPRPYSLFQGGHHGPFPAAVITQPVLPSYNSRRPDFLWLSADSMNYWAVPIEIERPQKRWFTNKGIPSGSLNQAIDQLRDWKRWFSEPHNVQAFQEYYEIPRLSHQVFSCHYVLAYGRRQEATQGPGKKKRPFIKQHDETFMSLDRLEPDRELANVITVRREGDSYRAMHVQPTLELYRFNCAGWEVVEGVEDAIQANVEISPDRKAHLLTKLGMWREQLRHERSSAC